MPNCVSLFTGAGGFDIGLRAAGYDIVFATDIEPLCRDTYLHAANEAAETPFLVSDISKVSASVIERHATGRLKDLDLLVGGPPCPPYSKSRFYRKDKPRGISDPVADTTLRGYLRVLRTIKPKTFIFENVAGFAYKVHPEGYALLRRTAERLGYHLACGVVNAADYGVPQIRERFIMLGRLKGAIDLPPATHRSPNEQSDAASELFPDDRPFWRTAGEVLMDLDTEDNASDAGHFAGGKHHKLLKQIPPGDNYLFFTKERGHPTPQFRWRSRYWSFLLKLSPDKPSWTIQARRSNNMGPFHWRSRILRIAEVKRLQTFPDNWHLAGTVEQQWRQLGNAIPPLLAEVLGRHLLAARRRAGSRT